MNNLQKFFALLLLFSLISCDDHGAKSTTEVQQTPDIDVSHTSLDIEQLKARLFDSPEDFSALSSLGDLYFESAQYHEAIQIYDKALAVNPACADCLNDRGLALFYTGDPQSALESFDQAIALEPGYAHAWLSKGFVLVSEGRFQEAILPLNRVKELDMTGTLTIEADKFLALAAAGNLQ